MFDKGPDHSQGYKKPWLIQRLKQPYKTENQLTTLLDAFSFGGGLKNGGLTDDAMKLLKTCFTFDYMGSAEFEFGAVPAALAYIYDNRKKYETFELPVTTEEGCDGLLLCIIPTAFKDEIRTFLLREVYKDRYGDLKEITRLHAVVRVPPEDLPKQRIQGWLELDNGFFFFTDSEMYEKVAALFGLEMPEEV